MEKVKQIPKKFLAMILSFVLLISAIPFGVFSVFAAGDDCIATEINSTKVYFYGIDALETKELTVKYEGGEGSIAVFVGGTEVTDDTGISVSGKSVTFDEDWLDEQTDWIAIKCDSTASIPSNEPSVDIDNTAPVISGVDGNPTEWAKSATLTVNSTDTDIYSYSIDKANWQTEKTFNVTENEDYSLYAKDKSGNISDAYEITVDKIDLIPPTINDIYPDPSNWTSSKSIMVVDATDDASGLNSVAYKLDNGEWQTSNAFDVSDNEPHKFYVRDALGNDIFTEAQATNFDNIKPTIDSAKLFHHGQISGTDYELDLTKDHTNSLGNYFIELSASDNEHGSQVAGYYMSSSELTDDQLNSLSQDDWQNSSRFHVDSGSRNYFYCID
ncbi:MAG: hypothetical protein IJ643_11215, partial [Eubacterium sp.]|nr:hypothetical protein [Eubacterium sp.]